MWLDLDSIVRILASVIALSSPLVIAGVGETLSERAGVVNLSIDGAMLLAAMTGFAVAYLTGNVWLGFLGAATVGSVVAFLIVILHLQLKMNLIAVGTILFITCRALSAFLGQPYTRLPGPTAPHFGIPILKDLPVVGPILFDQNVVTYISFGVAISAWWWLFYTQRGLVLRGVGEHPAAAYARGVDVRLQQYIYTILGGACIGFAGAAYSLHVKLGWNQDHTIGLGWIALVLVIFGQWHPLKVAAGAYLFGILLSVAGRLQVELPNLPAQVLPLLPYPMMIFISYQRKGGFLRNWLPRLFRSVAFDEKPTQ